MTEIASTTWTKKVAGAVLVCYWLALVAGTHVPAPPHLLVRGVSDKWLHLVAYAGLAFLVCVNWSLWRPWNWRHCLALVAALALFGAIDELTQIPVGRECDLADWVADMIGTGLGLTAFVALWLVQRRGSARTR
jgi:VanZ family protein